MKIQVAIVGFGKMGKVRHKLLKEHPQFNIVDVLDEHFSEQPNSFQSFENIFLKKVDAIFIATPPSISTKLCEIAIKNKVHIFCEKPPAINAKRMKHIIDLKKNPDQILYYAFNHRQHDSIQAIFEAHTNKAFGKLQSINGVYGKPSHSEGWRQDPKLAGGGILIDQGIHLLDIIVQIMGRPKLEKSLIHFIKPKLEDEISIKLSNNDVFAEMISSSRLPSHKFHLELKYENAKVAADGILSQSGAYAPETFRTFDKNSGKLLTEKTFKQDFSWKKEIELFAKAITTGDFELVQNYNEAYELMLLVDEIYTKAEIIA